MSIQTELNRISENISNAYAAAQEKGAELPAAQNSGNLEAAIRSIPEGTTLSYPLDPIEVYKATRPADWLPMPEPQDDEMYLLFHIPDGASSLLAFTVTCTGNYTVALGTVTNGQFVQQNSTSNASGVKYEAELFADDYGDLTSDGLKQVMVKVSGTNILTFEPNVHSKKTSPASFANWNIVEIACRLPNGEKVVCGNEIEAKALKKLRYFSWYGVNFATSMGNMFSNCCSLTAILELDTQNVTSMNYMFQMCYSLTAIPELDTHNVTSMNGMFQYCCSLTSIPELDTQNVTSMSYMFQMCYGLTTIPELDTHNVTSMIYMFQYCRCLSAIPELDTQNVTSMNCMFQHCYCLTSIPELDIQNVTSMSNMFNNCYSLTAIPELDIRKVMYMGDMFTNCYALSKITLNNSAVGWSGYAISLKGCSLMHNELVELLNSLPTITSSKSLTLTGNPGASELTDSEKAIAASKNWSLTI